MEKGEGGVGNREGTYKDFLGSVYNGHGVKMVFINIDNESKARLSSHSNTP